MIQNITETKPLRDSDFDISVLNFCNEIAKIFSNSILPDNFDHKLYDQIKKEKENHLILANDRVKREQYLKYLRFKKLLMLKVEQDLPLVPIYYNKKHW